MSDLQHNVSVLTVESQAEEADAAESQTFSLDQQISTVQDLMDKVRDIAYGVIDISEDDEATVIEILEDRTEYLGNLIKAMKQVVIPPGIFDEDEEPEKVA